MKQFLTWDEAWGAASMEIGGVVIPASPVSALDAKDQLQQFEKVQARAMEIWMASMREASGFSQEVFDLAFGFAYEQGHSFGYDTVASKFCAISEFMDSLMKISLERKMSYSLG